MILLATFLGIAAVAPELESLDQAIARCDRGVLNPAFAAETERRSRFLTQSYREQEQIVLSRLELAERRRALREPVSRETIAATATPDTEEQLNMLSLDIEDRQHALNDRRLLENIRQDAMDAKRRHYLTHCASGRERSGQNGQAD